MGKDLSVWKDGITYDKFKEAQEWTEGTHYQIINHQLYREKECLLDFRYYRILVVANLREANTIRTRKEG